MKNLILLVCLFILQSQITFAAEASASLQNLAIWGPRFAPWTEVVVRISRERRTDLEKAADLDVFCPGYRHSSLAKQDACWLRLVSGMVKFESNFMPGDSFLDIDGVESIGLLSLPVGECAEAPTSKDLRDPLRNLQCGVNKLADLIAEFGYLDGPEGAQGPAGYWSVLRPRTLKKVGDRKLWLGYKEKIIELIQFSKL